MQFFCFFKWVEEEENLSDKIQQSIIFCSFVAVFLYKKGGSVGCNKARVGLQTVKKKKKN